MPLIDILIPKGLCWHLDGTEGKEAQNAHRGFSVPSLEVSLGLVPWVGLEAQVFCTPGRQGMEQLVAMSYARHHLYPLALCSTIASTSG